MREERGVAQELALAKMLTLRPDQPRYALVLKCAVLAGNKANVRRTIERPQDSGAHCGRERSVSTTASA
jgi:hypothetical protein